MTESPYARPIASINDDDTVSLRASQLMACRRKLFYAAVEDPKSDQLPAQTQARMDMGTVLEKYILEQMEREGWQFEDLPQGMINVLQLTPEIEVTGIIDAIGRPPGGHNGIVEVKTRNAENMRHIEKLGSGTTHPGAVAQLAVYREMAVCTGLITKEDPCVIVNLNKDSSELFYEWFSPETLEEKLNYLHDRLSEMVKSWMSGDPPPPDHKPDSWQCRSCEWKTHCGNVEAPEVDAVAVGPITIEEARDALLQYEDAKAIEDAHTMDPGLATWARTLLLDYCQQQGVEKLALGGKVNEYSVSVMERDTVSWNVERLQFYLTEAQMKEVREVKNGKPYVVIRKGKRI